MDFQCWRLHMCLLGILWLVLFLYLSLWALEYFLELSKRNLKSKRKKKKNKKLSEKNEIVELKTALEEVRAKVGEAVTKTDDIEEPKAVAQTETDNNGGVQK